MSTEKKSIWKTAKLFVAVCAFILIAGAGMNAKAATTAPVGTVTVKQDGDTSSKVQMKWNYLTGADYYQVQLSSTLSGTYKDLGYTDSNSCVIDKLNAGKTYYVKVIPFVADENGNKVLGTPSAAAKAVTSPAQSPKTLKQTAATSTSITMSWSKVSGATGYKVLYKKYGTSSLKTVNVNATKKKFTGLSKDSNYVFYVYAVRKDGSYTAVSDSYTYLKYTLPTLPTKVTGLKALGFTKSGSTAYLKCNAKKSADGLYYEVLDGRKKIKSGTTSSYNSIKISSSKLKKAKFYKVRVRGFIKIGSKKVYGSWSDYTYICRQAKLKTSGNINGLNLKWDKVSGATSYTVYMSTNLNSGYKKVATTKSNRTTLTKFGKSNFQAYRNYYIYVVANKKVGGKTYKSADDYSTRIFFY